MIREQNNDLHRVCVRHVVETFGTRRNCLAPVHLLRNISTKVGSQQTFIVYHYSYSADSLLYRIQYLFERATFV